MTVIELVERSAQALDEAGVAFGQGTLNAFDEAAWLVLWQLGHPLDELDEVAGREVPISELQAVDALVQRRITTRKPTAYLTGEAWLQGVPFFVDENVIIPRSLIAEPLAEGVLDAWLPAGSARVLDLCTGNGSLAVLAALAWPQARVRACDISAPALALARRNVDRHGLQGRIELAQGDGLAAAAGTWDLILCNPPYVTRESMQQLPPEFRAEPVLALDGGADGMAFIRSLMQGLKRSLEPQGALVLEVGRERDHFEAAFPKLDAIWLATTAGDDQVVLLQREALP